MLEKVENSRTVNSKSYIPSNIARVTERYHSEENSQILNVNDSSDIKSNINRYLDSALDRLSEANRDLQKSFKDIMRNVDELSDNLNELKSDTSKIRWELEGGYHPSPFPWIIVGTHKSGMPEDTAYAVAADINVSKALDALKDIKREVRDAERYASDFDIYVTDIDYYARKGDKERAYDATREAYRALDRTEDVTETDDYIDELKMRLRKAKHQLDILYDYLPAGWTLPPADMEELIESALRKAGRSQDTVKELEHTLEKLERAIEEARRRVREVQRELSHTEKRF